MGFIMGNKQRERVVQVLGSKGKMSAEKIAKVRAHPCTIRQEDPGRDGRKTDSSSRMKASGA